MTKTDFDKIILSMTRTDLENITHALSVLEVFYESPEQASEINEAEVAEMLDTLFSFKEVCNRVLDSQSKQQ
jgi:hypothetical protein